VPDEIKSSEPREKGIESRGLSVGRSEVTTLCKGNEIPLFLDPQTAFAGP